MLTKRIGNPRLRGAVEWAAAFLAAVLLFVVLRSFVFRVADVNGNSMEPTLRHGDFVVLSKVGYWLGEPKRGDIVAFPFKGEPSEFYIKRVIGIPGDVVDIIDNRFTVNGEDTVYLFPEDIEQYGDVGFPYVVEDGAYFMLGDNRNLSKDSRYQSVGVVPKSIMVGKVVLRIWPLGRFGPVG
jgi:signal peptidase I